MRRPKVVFRSGLAPVVLGAFLGCCEPGELDPLRPGQGSGGSVLATGGRDGVGGSTSSGEAGDGGTEAVPEVCATPLPTGGTEGVGQGPDPFVACEHPELEVKCEDGWCEIPAGCFVMGSPEREWGHAPYEEIQVAVTLTRSFLIQQTEVTIEQWTEQGMEVPTYDADSDGLCPTMGFPCAEPCLESDCPIASISWVDAIEYANLLSERHAPPLAPCYDVENSTGLTAPTAYDCEGFRLPTDAEWEYAARAGTRTSYYSGDNVAYGDYAICSSYCQADANLERVGWYCYNSGGQARPVGQLQPNSWGLYDTLGNVAEWNNDESDGYGALTSKDPGGAIGSGNRNRRGGWYGVWAGEERSANQAEASGSSRGSATGFRLVRTLSWDKAPPAQPELDALPVYGAECETDADCPVDAGLFCRQTDESGAAVACTEPERCRCQPTACTYETGCPSGLSCVQKDTSPALACPTAGLPLPCECILPGCQTDDDCPESVEGLVIHCRDAEEGSVEPCTDSCRCKVTESCIDDADCAYPYCRQDIAGFPECDGADDCLCLMPRKLWLDARRDARASAAAE